MMFGSNSKSYFYLTILFMAAFVCFGIGCKPPQKQAVPHEKITIAYSTASNAMLMYIAFANGYFAQEGLDATPQPHAFGKIALNAMIEGKADIATAGDTPIVFAVMGGKKIQTLAVIQTSSRNEAIVARKDKGITKPSDLRGKTIGVTLGTTGDFFADSFLVANGIDRKQVRFIDMKPDEMADALGNERVDAVSTWNPTLKQLQKELGANGHIFYGETLYTEAFCVAAGQEFVRQRPEATRKVLRALIKAEAFAKQRPEEARRLIAEFIKTDRAVLDETWDIFNLRVTLDQALLMDFEEQTRWAIKNQLTAGTAMPNYLDFIYIDGLKTVKPESVSIIR